MSETGSISVLLQDLKDGDEQALAQLHQRCKRWLELRARRRLDGHTLRHVDEEDIAQEAFVGFVASVRNGRVPQLETRHDLFALLTHIVACKTSAYFARHLAAKRGGGRVRGESALDARSPTAGEGGLSRVPDQAQSPAEELALLDEYRHYLAALPISLRAVAELYVAGLTNREIAMQLGRVERTVERKLALVRDRWRRLAADELSS